MSMMKRQSENWIVLALCATAWRKKGLLTTWVAKLALCLVIAQLPRTASAQNATLSGGSLILGDNWGQTESRVYLAGGDNNHYIYSTGTGDNNTYFGEWGADFHFIDTAGDTEALTLSGGNVGIGEAAPQNNLHISGFDYTDTGMWTCTNRPRRAD